MKRLSRYARTVALVIGLLLMQASLAEAGSVVSIRLVEAHNASTEIAGGLSDVKAMLKRNLPYTGYALLGSSSMPLPASGARRIGDYTISCEGAQAGLRVKVTRGRQQLAATTLNVKDGAPVFFGGFTGGRGKMLVVLVAR